MKLAFKLQDTSILFIYIHVAKILEHSITSFFISVNLAQTKELNCFFLTIIIIHFQRRELSHQPVTCRH